MLVEALIPSTLYTVYKSGVIGLNWYKLYTGKELESNSNYKELVTLDETRFLQRTPFMFNVGNAIIPVGQDVEDTEVSVFTKLVHEKVEESRENIEPRGFSIYPGTIYAKTYINTAEDFGQFCENYKVNPYKIPIRLPLVKRTYKLPSNTIVYSSKDCVWAGPKKSQIARLTAISHSFESHRGFGVFLGAAMFTVVYGGVKFGFDWRNTKWELKNRYPSLFNWVK